VLGGPRGQVSTVKPGAAVGAGCDESSLVDGQQEAELFA